MKRDTIAILSKHKIAIATAFTGFLLAPDLSAQTFAYSNNDLALGFRKTGIYQESYEAVIDIGSATNYVNLQSGTTIPVPNFTAAQLSPDTFSDLDFLSWSVIGFARTNTISVLPGYQNNTLWLTAPRSAPATQSAPPSRLSFGQQGAVVTQIKSILSGAAYLSSLSSAGPDNTATFVIEPVNNTANLSSFIGSVVDSSGSTLRDTWPSQLETTTPANFAAASMADFYEVRPTVDPQGNPVTDPHTGQTSGDAYYLGFFTLNANGSMTFTRGSSTVITNLPPSAPTLTISRTDNSTHIALTTDKGATYTLYSTDTAGLAMPLTSWTALPTKITGDGSSKEFVDTSTDAIRFYRVSAQ